MSIRKLICFLLLLCISANAEWFNDGNGNLIPDSSSNHVIVGGAPTDSASYLSVKSPLTIWGGNYFTRLNLGNQMANIDWLLPIAQGAAGTCLQNDGSGNLSWGTCGGVAAWGSITGTLSSQTDLATALSGKQSTITFGTGVQSALGNALNGASGLVQLNSSSQLPAVDGSLLTNLPPSGQVFPPSNDLSMGNYYFTKFGGAKGPEGAPPYSTAVNWNFFGGFHSYLNVYGYNTSYGVQIGTDALGNGEGNILGVAGLYLNSGQNGNYTSGANFGAQDEVTIFSGGRSLLAHNIILQTNKWHALGVADGAVNIPSLAASSGTNMVTIDMSGNLGSTTVPSTSYLPLSGGNVTGTVNYNDGTNNYNMTPKWPASAVTCTTSATINFNSQAAATVELDLTASDACVLTIAGTVTGGAYVIKVKNASAATITWPGSVDWGAMGSPTLSATGVFDDVHLLVQQSTSYIHAYISQGFSH